jgi:aminopeptidase YwaD
MLQLKPKIVRREVASNVQRHLHTLAVEIGERPVGSANNRRAGVYIAAVLRAAGCHVEELGFDCLDWHGTSASLAVGDVRLPARPNPYTPPCWITAPLVCAGTLEELGVVDLLGHIVVLHGDLAREALFPKNFPFFQVEAHQRIIQILESEQPAAVVAVSSRDGITPPLIEDGDLHLPSVTVQAGAGPVLLANEGKIARLHIEAQLAASHGATILGRRGPEGKGKMVVTAHFDTKHDTPGALDNASGTAALLALAEALTDEILDVGVEFVAFNGEDNYAAPGQVAYLAAHGAEFPGIRLVANIDGAGWCGHPVSIAEFDCPAPLAAEVKAIRKQFPAMVDVPPWPQGDHSIFWMQGVPCIAFSSVGIEALIDTHIHTPDDTLDGVDACAIADVTSFLHALIVDHSDR